MSITNSDNRDFGSVFRIGSQGGPRYSNIKNSAGLPNWPDLRTPGNTSSNEQASRIIERWDVSKMKRFEIFMERFYRHKERDTSLWRKEWLDKTTGNYFKSGELKIVKCKLELIKRLLIIKVLGPQSLEDWVLLFMYHDNELAIPLNIEQMMRPDSALVLDEVFLQDKFFEYEIPRGFAITASETSMEYPGNMRLHSFPNVEDRPRYVSRIPRGLTIQEIAANRRNVDHRTGIFPRGTARDHMGTYFPGNPLRGNNQGRTPWTHAGGGAGGVF